VQYVTRPNLDFRGFCGTIAGGVINVGDVITAMPSGKSSTVERIVTADGDLPHAMAGDAITLTMNDEIDISRGDVIVKSNQLATSTNNFEATIVWMDEAALQPGKEYEFKVGTKNTYGRIESINHRIDVNTQQHVEVNEIQLNEIASCHVNTTSPVVIDEYISVKGTGSFVVIDRLTNVTVGAGMITKTSSKLESESSELTADSLKLKAREYTQSEIELNAYIRKCFPEWGCEKAYSLVK
jgi:sulfate adenylyltransferase subunit 1